MKNWWPPSQHWLPMGQWLNMFDKDDIGNISVQIAEALVGLSPRSTMYCEAMYPGDEPTFAKAMAKYQSACALLGACVLRCMGHEHKLLEPPYYGRNDAVSRLVKIAQEEGAYEPEGYPENGDLLLIGNPEHILVVTGVDPNAHTVSSIDGGRGPIARVVRDIVTISGKDRLRDRWFTRRIVGCIHVKELSFTREWVIPRQ